jgi:hypothetical protein
MLVPVQAQSQLQQPGSAPAGPAHAAGLGPPAPVAGAPPAQQQQQQQQQQAGLQQQQQAGLQQQQQQRRQPSRIACALLGLPMPC